MLPQPSGAAAVRLPPSNKKRPSPSLSASTIRSLRSGWLLDLARLSKDADFSVTGDSDVMKYFESHLASRAVPSGPRHQLLGESVVAAWNL